MATFKPEHRVRMYQDAHRIVSSYLFASNSDDLLSVQVPLSRSDENRLTRERDDELAFFYETLHYSAFLRRIESLLPVFQEALARMSREKEFAEVELFGQIRGRFNVEKYINDLPRMQFPPRFWCQVYEDQYDLPENVFLALVILWVKRKLTELPFPESEWKQTALYRRVVTYQAQLEQASHMAELETCISVALDILDDDHQLQLLLEDVRFRIQHRVVENPAYDKLVAWWDRFGSGTGLVKAEELHEELLFYGSAFDDKLFELWILERIHTELCRDGTFKVVDRAKLFERRQKPIFALALQPNGQLLKIYFQKSKNLVWGSETPRGPLEARWRRLIGRAVPDELVDDEFQDRVDDFLHGYLDIIVTFEDGKEYPPVLIDVKNIPWNNRRAVSERVYKMIGYLDNFASFATSGLGAPRGVLVFRHDDAFAKSDSEPLWTESYRVDARDAHNLGAEIAIFTASPASSESGARQIGYLCQYILNQFGLLGHYINFNRAVRPAVDSLSSQVRSQDIDSDSEGYLSAVQAFHDRVHKLALPQVANRRKDLRAYRTALQRNNFGPLWTKLPPRVRTVLSIAEMLTSHMAGLWDQAPACVEYCRALEIALNRLLIMPFLKYVNSDPARTNAINTSGSANLRSLLSKRRLEMGKLAKELENLASPDRRVLKDFLTSAVPVHLQDYMLHGFGAELQDFTQGFRNRVAHTGVADLNMVETCRLALLIGIPNPRPIRATRFERLLYTLAAALGK